MICKLGKASILHSMPHQGLIADPKEAKQQGVPLDVEAVKGQQLPTQVCCPVVDYLAIGMIDHHSSRVN